MSEVSEVTPTRLPRRSATVLIGPSGSTVRQVSSGGPAIAATPFTGAPLATRPRSSPTPNPTSMLPAASACCCFAGPPNVAGSMVSPSAAKRPRFMPKSSSMKVKDCGIASPTRIVAAAPAGGAISAASASAISVCFIICPLTRGVEPGACEARVEPSADRN